MLPWYVLRSMHDFSVVVRHKGASTTAAVICGAAAPTICSTTACRMVHDPLHELLRHDVHGFRPRKSVAPTCLPSPGSRSVRFCTRSKDASEVAGVVVLPTWDRSNVRGQSTCDSLRVPLSDSACWPELRITASSESAAATPSMAGAHGDARQQESKTRLSELFGKGEGRGWTGAYGVVWCGVCLSVCVCVSEGREPRVVSTNLGHV